MVTTMVYAENNNKKLTDIINKTKNSYIDRSVNVENITAYYTSETDALVKECLSQPSNEKDLSNNVNKGIALFISYYYIARLNLKNKPLSDFHYPTDSEKLALTFSSTLKNISGKSLIKKFGVVVGEVKYADARYLYQSLKEMNLYYEKFIKNKNNENILMLSSIKFLSNEHFYNLGFEKHKNPCFRADLFLENIMIKGHRKVVISVYSIDGYFYGFWLRRYNDGTINKVKKFLDFTLWSLKSSFSEIDS